ncbi:MAG: glutamine--fructose-6-phosphate transaminase (isomerizing) [Schleiferiaceae bacterium]|tara:strand:+ start:17673 stop:19511 length:1839 start_codon:yes stop_codon:yes gene_type:complete
MCGIVGYLGNKEAYPILINGLKRLEYRGYDSSGIALFNGDIEIYKCKGKVERLESLKNKDSSMARLGIGHTRWATHGPPNDKNAHPHVSNNGDLVIVHNGIIENADSLRIFLFEKNYSFKSDTDTEVLVNLIEYIQKEEKVSLEEAVRLSLNQVIGAYAISVISKSHPDVMIAARLGSPLVLGLGNNEFFIGSDATPFIDQTKKVIYLDDGELARISKQGISIRTIDSDTPVDAVIHQLQMDLESIEKGGFEHFMLKEIYEQPISIQNTIRGRLFPEKNEIKMAGLEMISSNLKVANRIIILGCGTSWHAGLVGEYLIEEFSRVPVEVEYASEFRYRNPVINSNDVVIAISQSGETADTLAAIKLAKESGASVFGICNVVGSSIARETDAGAFTHAGPEIGVASTKAFTAQVTVLAMVALYLGKIKNELTKTKFREIALEINKIPEKIESMLELDSVIKTISKSLKGFNNSLFLGRGFNFPVALEGALKLKEISYIHAEGYPAAEMKHGPIALIDKNMPIIVIAPLGGMYEKLVSNIQEVKARKGKIISITGFGQSEVKSLSDAVIEIPDTLDCLSPLLTTIPLQLLSYHVAVERGCNVDQPRNLAKAVTVE